MKKIIYLFIIFFIFVNSTIMANENIMILKTKYGEVEIELYADKAPNHVKRFKDLADSGKYDGVVFHRVIDGFMAQTGDVKFGNTKSPNFNLALAGTGGSDLPNLKAEFTDIAHTRGILSAARSADPNSANFLFVLSQLRILIDNILLLAKLSKVWNILTKLKKVILTPAL